MTDGILNTIGDWTGTAAITCPWRAFFDPFVRRVLDAYRLFVEHQIHWAHPNPSAKLVAGVVHYDAAVKGCEAKRMELQRDEARAKSAAAEARMRGGQHGR